MKRSVYTVWCILSLAATIMAQARYPKRQPPATPTSPYSRPVVMSPPYRGTWYNALMKQFNPDNLDWGQWIEQRRDEFLKQTAANPYFKYSLVTTLLLIMLTMALTKTLIDKSRIKWLAQERHEDLLRHDAYSREEARAAIRKYNDHIEKCNRVVEAELSGRSVFEGQAATQAGAANSDEKLLKLADTERARAALEVKLKNTNAIVADLTGRLNEAQAGHNGQRTGDVRDPAVGMGTTELTRMISELQQQLYHERERNKRLKGL